MTNLLGFGDNKQENQETISQSNQFTQSSQTFRPFKQAKKESLNKFSYLQLFQIKLFRLKLFPLLITHYKYIIKILFEYNNVNSLHKTCIKRYIIIGSKIDIQTQTQELIQHKQKVFGRFSQKKEIQKLKTLLLKFYNITITSKKRDSNSSSSYSQNNIQQQHLQVTFECLNPSQCLIKPIGVFKQKYCYNYKINRIDRKGGLINLTLDPIDRPFVPVDVVKEMMAKGGEILLDTFWQHHHKKQQLFSGTLDQREFQVLDQNQLLEFENSISSKPVACYIQIGNLIYLYRKQGRIAYLACLGINAEILIHYAQETGLFPLPLFFAENEYNQQHLSNYFKLNTYNNGYNELMAINYNGQKFPVKFNFHNYYIYDQVQKCYFEYIFFIWDLDKRWISKSRILENYKDYFNLKEIPNSKKSQQSDKSTEFQGEELRCGYKIIINR